MVVQDESYIGAKLFKYRKYILVYNEEPFEQMENCKYTSLWMKAFTIVNIINQAKYVTLDLLLLLFLHSPDREHPLKVSAAAAAASRRAKCALSVV